MKVYETDPFGPVLLKYTLTKTTRRLTFDILFQDERTRYRGEDDGEYFRFVASNGYVVDSRSRMDLHTEHIWLLGAKDQDRSGSAIFSSNEKRDKAYNDIKQALDEWAAHYNGRAEHCTLENEPPRFPPIDNRDAWIGAKPGFYLKDYTDSWAYYPPEKKEAALREASDRGSIIREVTDVRS